MKVKKPILYPYAYNIRSSTYLHFFNIYINIFVLIKSLHLNNHQKNPKSERDCKEKFTKFVVLLSLYSRINS